MGWTHHARNELGITDPARPRTKIIGTNHWIVSGWVTQNVVKKLHKNPPSHSSAKQHLKTCAMNA